MKNLRLAVLFTIVFLTAVSAYPQQKLRGKVVEIVDGKTVIIELYTNYKITARLQFIEVPEPEQPLFQTVRDHLRKLTLGQDVEFQPVRLFNSMSVGRLFANGIDISQQMIRDGAAWYAVLEKSAQSGEESVVYQKTEAQAKTEKRGVWSIENLKPAWEFRSEKNSQTAKTVAQEAEQSLLNNESKLAGTDRLIPKGTSNQNSQKLGIELFSGSSDNTPNFSPIYKYNPENNKGFLSTPFMFFDVSDGSVTQRIMFGIGYEFIGRKVPKGGDKFGLAVGSAVDFLSNKNVTIYANDKTLLIGKPKLTATPNNEVKINFYEISRSTLDELASADSAVIKIGRYQRSLDKSILSSLVLILSETR